MKKYTVLFSLVLVFLFQACNKDDDPIVYPDGIRYTVTFNINWNSQDFPTNYPSNAHFSKLIGWSHESTSTFFQPGTSASAGIENMAETGGTSPLSNEIEEMIAAGEGHHLVVGSGLGAGSGTISVDIIVTEDFPSVTLASMIAPSPDWYIAVVNINLMEAGSFVNEKTVNAYVYDSGTDDGITYTSADIESNPQQTISLFIDSPLGDGLALNAVIAEVTFLKQE
jgi:hypothetical protein